jgi:hypothetical protein
MTTYDEFEGTMESSIHTELPIISDNKKHLHKTSEGAGCFGVKNE